MSGSLCEHVLCTAKLRLCKLERSMHIMHTIVHVRVFDMELVVEEGLGVVQEGGLCVFV